MAYANHVNSKLMGGKPILLGRFTHKETGVTFEYSERPANDRGGWAREYQHLIYVGGPAVGKKGGYSDETRIGRVKGTVAYVSVDEDASGRPVMQKWPIKQHKNCTRTTSKRIFSP